MKSKEYIHLGLLLLAGGIINSSATDRFVALDGGHVPPFASWADAATNIQAAIDAASAGDIVWVTNGVYATGGKVMAGDLTNRVALDKALTVQSVNGPFVTTIQGAGAFTGTAAVRCAWLTNGATLTWFILTGGGTRQTGDGITLASGGGVWCASSNATVVNCLIVTNTCAANGSGAFQGTLQNCLVRGNTPRSAYQANLINCTVASNSSFGVLNCRLTNSIVAHNTVDTFVGCTLAYCCTLNYGAGVSNIIGSPRLLPDGIHLASDSPCRAAGTSVSSGVDIDGEAWLSPPSIGCDQWQPAPSIVGQLQVQITNNPTGFNIRVAVEGQQPFTCWWFQDGNPLADGGRYSGAQTTNLVAIGLFPSDVGSYQVVVSNAFGVATGTLQIFGRYVDAAGADPMAPYSSWATAATSIQDAIDAAQPGEIVVVTNGVYATGGKVKAGGLTNRVALDKPIPVLSVNGSGFTIIQGQVDPTTTNGPLAVRCAWMTNGAILSGFTLRGGATSDSSDFNLASGGGVWCSSVDAQLVNCRIVDNFAGSYGGGAYYGTLNNCIISNNAGARYCRGGGAANSTLKNCLVVANSAYYGGGTYMGWLYNCAVIRNFASGDGGGCDQSQIDNCTVSLNYAGLNGTGFAVNWLRIEIFARNCAIWNNNGAFHNHRGLGLSNCCTYPLPSGGGNISVDPQLLGDGYHLAATSPCIGAGSSLSLTGTDIDGQSWASPSAIGCDEWHPEPLVLVRPLPRPAVGDGQVQINAVVAGDPIVECTWTKNGHTLADDMHYTNSSSANLLIHDFGVGDAGAYQVKVSNAFGVVTSQVVQVTVRCVDAASAVPVSPYTTWESAATTIQDAVDVAGATDVVLVTNGIYASGGRTNSGALTNRVVVNKSLLLVSAQGPDHTVIEGQWDPTSTNGPAAVRCAWLGDGAALSGFTLRNSATLHDLIGYDGIGGGAWCSSTNAELVNCIITNCHAWWSAGGVYSGLVSNSKLVGNASEYTDSLTSGGGGASSSTLINCAIIWNTSASKGGGARNSRLYNCLIAENSAGNQGGGASDSGLVNCTVAVNSAVLAGGGVYTSVLTNCIVYFNSASMSPNVVYPLTSQFTCSTPLLAGTGNISDDPQLTDGWHLSATSPCRGLGSASAVTGTDLEGDPWANPPSMGCDEVYDAAFVGSLSVGLTAAYPEVPAYGSLPLIGQISGRAATTEWSFGEGASFTNLSSLTYHSWTNPGDYLVIFTAYNVDNPNGVSTNLSVHVVPLVSPQLSAAGLSDTGFTLTFPGQAGITYIVEQATNLAAPVVWQTVQTLVSPGALMQVTDTKATNAMRFYRTRMQ